MRRRLLYFENGVSADPARLRSDRPRRHNDSTDEAASVGLQYRRQLAALKIPLVDEAFFVVVGKAMEAVARRGRQE